jgi:hypothetical protein
VSSLNGFARGIKRYRMVEGRRRKSEVVSSDAKVYDGPSHSESLNFRVPLFDRYPIRHDHSRRSKLFRASYPKDDSERRASDPRLPP